MTIGNGLVLVRTTITDDPTRQGKQLRLEYVGNAVSVQATSDSLRAAGFQVVTTLERGQGRLIILVPDQSQIYGGAEVPEERWELDSNIQEVDFMHTGKVQNAVDNDTRQKVLAAIRDTTADTDRSSAISPFSANATAVSAYDAKIGGTESVPQPRPVLRHTRTYSPQYAQRLQVDTSPNRYTTASLISTFSVPAIIQSQLPSDPSLKPDGTTWGWVLMRHSQETVFARLTQVTETREWQFAAWLDFLFDDS